MTSNHKGRRAETVRLQNVSTTNPAQLWLAGLAPAGRKGMQSQLRRCAGILLPGSDIDSYPWQMLNYTGVMLVRSALLNEGYREHGAVGAEVSCRSGLQYGDTGC